MTNRFNTPNVQFFANPVTGEPLAGGLLYFYATGTSTPQDTYSNVDLNISHVNTNPVVLDSNGFSGNIFLQNLAYKVVLKDSTGVQVWTADPVDTSDFSTVAQFQVNAGTPQGTVAGTAGTPGGLPSSVVWDSTNSILYVCTTSGTAGTAVWTAVNASSTTTVVVPPQGYLTLTSGTPVIGGDVLGSSAVYYTPFVGNQIPIFNGASMIQTIFTELTMTLTSAQALNTIYDFFVFSNSGVPTIVVGPAWSVSTAGSGARGSGAGTSQLTRVSGLLVNAVQLSGKNGATTYTIAANMATYVGSIFIDGSAGQVSCDRSFGQSRKWGVWNAYNQQPIYLQVGDGTATWNYSTATWRASNNTSANNATIFLGLDQQANVEFVQSWNSASNASTAGTPLNGIGFNSTTAPSGKNGRGYIAPPGVGAGAGGDLVSRYIVQPFHGINVLTCLENGSGGTTITWVGTNASMLMTVNYLG